MMKERYEKMLPGARLWTGALEMEAEAIEQNVERLCAALQVADDVCGHGSWENLPRARECK